MHMRRKKWARPELSVCPFYTIGGEEYRGHWRERFPEPERPLHLEMGCGKGVSTALMAADNPGINYVAVDISADVLGDARRNIVRECGEDVSNVQLVLKDICFFDRIFAGDERVERIYISFCNPWTEKPKQEKRRLTHPRQLIQYRQAMIPQGEIWFKTDDETLFQDSRAYFDLCGFEEVYMTEDLHGAGFKPNYISEHERKFIDMGIPIKFGIYRMTPREAGFDPLRFRLTPGVRRRTLENMDGRREDKRAGSAAEE